MPEPELERITAAEARPLRRGLLHPGLPLEAVDYPGDADAAAFHVGVLLEGLLIGIGTIHPAPVPGGDRTSSWRVRDIAIEHGHRGRGVGKMILGRLLEHAAGNEARIAWGAARLSAVGFFEHHGFAAFEAPWADPHEGEQRLLW
ncbi:MAG TPA: GNAT family N-acetyltransferase, partial [Acidimicrobiia bacterium]|nr:GNAT family N-acetyltransferase [Acidimicrobiia bacterium]